MSSLRPDFLWATILLWNLCGEAVCRELCYSDSVTGDEMYCDDLNCCGSNPTYCCDKEAFITECAVFGGLGVLFVVCFSACWIRKSFHNRKKKAAMKQAMDAKLKKTLAATTASSSHPPPPPAPSGGSGAQEPPPAPSGGSGAQEPAVSVSVISENGGDSGGMINRGFSADESVKGNAAVNNDPVARKTVNASDNDDGNNGNNNSSSSNTTTTNTTSNKSSNNTTTTTTTTTTTINNGSSNSNSSNKNIQPDVIQVSEFQLPPTVE